MDAAQQPGVPTPTVAPSGPPTVPDEKTGAPGKAWRPALFPAPAGRPTWTDRVELLGFIIVLAIAALTPARSSNGAANGPGMELFEKVGVSLCVFKTWTGIECGGCGLTRGFVQLAHGHPLEAARLNPMVWFAFAWTLWATLERVALVAFRRTLRHGIPDPWVWRLYSACFLGFIALWGIRLVFALVWG